ncbi:MAG: hypothetical protein AAF840_18765, partial [Bacteroidota bacterium]
MRPTTTYSSFFLCLLVLLLTPDLQSALGATDYTWTAPSGRWNDAANWMPNGIPGAGDRAIIATGAAVLIGNVTVAQLELSGGEVGTNNGSALTVSQDLQWGGGIIGCDLTLQNTGTATFSGGSKILREGQLVLNGNTQHQSGDITVTQAPASMVSAATYTLTSGTLNLAELDRSFTNHGTFLLQTDGEVTSGTGLFVNALSGSFTKTSGNGSTIFGSRFGQAGTFSHQTGDSLVFNDSLFLFTTLALNPGLVLRTSDV